MARGAQQQGGAGRPVQEDPRKAQEGLVVRRRVLGALCALFCVVMALALISYDWRDISWLCNPPSPPDGIPKNRIGQVGAWLTFFGYGFGGLAYRYFALPLLAVFAGFLLHGRARFLRLRTVWLAGLYVCLACLFQFYGGEEGGASAVLADLNLRPNAGGALGQWLVTGLLLPLLGNLGLPLVLWPLTFVFIVLIIGVRNCVFLMARLLSPKMPKKVDDGAELSARELLRARSEDRDGAEADSATDEDKRGFFARLFRKREEERVEAEDVRQLLASRGTMAKVKAEETWAVPEPDLQSEPLFAEAQREQEPEPAESVAVESEHAEEEPEEDGTPEVSEYTLPSTDLLDPVPPHSADADDVHVAVNAIESVFQQFDIDARVVGQVRGPVLTQFEILPAPKVKLEKFQNYERNLLMALRAESIRIQAPIPGRDVVGIEVPNAVRQSVTLREVLEGEVWRRAERRMALPLAMGKLATGGDLVVDLAEMPHLLVAGGTGSGKSVALNDMLVGLLMCRKPDQVRLIMVDPKRVEFTAYDNLPHLLSPVVVEPKRVIFSLRWAVVEMNRRYELLQRYGVRNIADYNRRVEAPMPNRENPSQKLPYIVIVIDELADLMLDVKSDIEPPITSLTQKARAAGLHLIIATQRPTTNVITGTIKANIPGRMALRVTQGNDSRTILDETGAERLIGKGDMLLARGGKATVRSQAAWISDGEILRVCDFIKEQSGPAFDKRLADSMSRIREEHPASDMASLIGEFIPEEAPQGVDVELEPDDDHSDEAYYQRALEYIRQTGRYSTSVLQRFFKIGYNKAARITDMLVERGIVSPVGKAGGSREILVDLNAMPGASVDSEGGTMGTDGENPADVGAHGESTAEGEDDFDLDGLDPSELDAPDIIHPTKS